MLSVLIAIFLLCPSAWAGGQGAWLTDWDSARKAARAAKTPVLVEFHAVWCYSCYYMEKHVLSSPAFQKAAAQLTLLKLDADTPEGQEMKEKYAARVLPTVLIADADGNELGRIVGEQTDADFLAQLSGIIGKPQAGGLERLNAALDRGDLAGAYRERERLKAGSLAQTREFKVFSARTDLLMASREQKPEAVAKALEALLGLEDGCALAFDTQEALEPLSPLAPARRKALLGRAASKLEALAKARVFGAKGERCADLRTAAYCLYEVYSALGDRANAAKLLGRVVGMLQQEAAAAGIGKDRNLEDNLRFFLEKAGRSADLDKLYPRLIAAYPADYVYPYRYAKNLLERREYARALPYTEQGLRLSYGANRLNAVGVKARILAGLGRKDEAAKLIKAELKSAGTRFKKESSALERALKELR
ncbi:MAG: thioredoxin family protein [Elusimicrobia bacterium]|nr:thioredoxin family protein [Elusimicrobiota bacterium]